MPLTCCINLLDKIVKYTQNILAFKSTNGITNSFAEIFGIRKLESLRYCVALFAWSYVAVSVEHRLVTDRWTN